MSLQDDSIQSIQANYRRLRQIFFPAGMNLVDRKLLVSKWTRGPCIVYARFQDFQPPTTETGKKIVADVCRKHGIGLLDFMSERKTSHLVKARHEAMYRIATETKLSYPKISALCGRKDHTSSIHGARKHADKHKLPRPGGRR